MFDKMREMYKLSNYIAEVQAKQVSGILFNEKAETPVNKIVGLLIIAVLAGALIPTAMTSLKAGSNESGDWTTSEVAVYGIIGIMIIIAVVLLVVKTATE